MNDTPMTVRAEKNNVWRENLITRTVGSMADAFSLPDWLDIENVESDDLVLSQVCIF